MTDPQHMLARLREANTPSPISLITDAIATIEALVTQQRDRQSSVANLDMSAFRETMKRLADPKNIAIVELEKERYAPGEMTDAARTAKNAAIDRLQLMVTRGDGVPLPDQAAAVREFIARYAVCKTCGMQGRHTDLCRIVETEL